MFDGSAATLVILALTAVLMGGGDPPPDGGAGPCRSGPVEVGVEAPQSEEATSGRGSKTEMRCERHAAAD